jgi:hypothetical protein
MSEAEAWAVRENLDYRKAWWGVRYVSALCAQAGFVFQETPPQSDVHSLDGQIFMRTGLSVFVQIKCTSRALTRQRSYPIKAAWRRNWTDLQLPGYFVVVSVPPGTPDWVTHGEKPWSTLLRSAAFWTRIDPLDQDQSSITVTTKNRMTVATLDEWATDLKSAVDKFSGSEA